MALSYFLFQGLLPAFNVPFALCATMLQGGVCIIATNKLAKGLVSLIIQYTIYISSLFLYRGLYLHTYFDVLVNGGKSGKRCTYHQLEPGVLGLE
jgi:hypothetical protein